MCKTMKSSCGGFDLGWMPGVHQATLSLPALQLDGREKYNKRLMGREKDREIAVVGNTDSTQGN